MLKQLTPAMGVSLVGLFFALTGGAFAAQHYLITSTKQIKPSVLTQLRGKAGPKGEQGTTGPKGNAGPAGPMGPAGARGAQGAQGAQGASGASGAQGTSGALGAQGLQGPQGPQGPQGAMGPQGIPGPGTTLHTYTLPDKTLSPTPIPSSDWNTTAGWTPWSLQTVGSAGGYKYSIACGDAKAYAQSDDWTRPNYSNLLQGKIEGNSLASEYGGQGQASLMDTYTQVYPPDWHGTDPPPPFTYAGSYGWDDDYSGEQASTFSRADGQVVKLWGHVKMTKDACSVSDVKLYVWS